VIVGLVGNAAEHYSAVTLAGQDDMDATLGIAVGSSTQIALFVAPVLVLASYAIAPSPMNLLFSPFEVLAIGLSVVVIAFIAHDGETHWIEGAQLLAVYVLSHLFPGQRGLPRGSAQHSPHAASAGGLHRKCLDNWKLGGCCVSENESIEAMRRAGN
jgi:hypothetical protein